MTDKDGGSAFPGKYIYQKHTDVSGASTRITHWETGMSKRYYTAVKAMQGLLPLPDKAYNNGILLTTWAEYTAEKAFKLADAMLAHEQGEHNEEQN